MAETLADRKEYGQAINQLRSALNLIGQEANASDTYQKTPQELLRTDFAALPLPESGATPFQRLRSWHGLLGSSSTGKWFGAILGLAVGSFLWFGQPDIGLDSTATKLLGLISGTLIFWVFRALPDYGVALIFAMIVILTKLESAQTVMGGFASTTWFMTLGVLGLGAAITGSGLFYRLSLHLRAHVSAELLLANHRHRDHGNRRHGADPAADRAHGDHQPNAGELIRKPGLQDSVTGIDRFIRGKLSRPRPARISLLDRFDDQPDRVGSLAERRARPVYLGLLVFSRVAADPHRRRHCLGLHHSALSAGVATEDFLHDGANSAQYTRPLIAQRMDQLRGALFHRNRLAHGRKPRHRRRLDRDHRLCGSRSTPVFWIGA